MAERSAVACARDISWWAAHAPRGPHPSLHPMGRRRRPRNPDSETLPVASGQPRPSKAKGALARSLAPLAALIRLPAVAPAAHIVWSRGGRVLLGTAGVPGFGSCLHSFGQSLGAPCRLRGTCRARSGKLKPGRLYKDMYILLLSPSYHSFFCLFIARGSSFLQRLSALVILYTHPLKRIFLPSHQDSLLYISFFCTRRTLNFILYTN